MNHFYTIHIVFKSFRIKKIGDRCKPRHFGWASPTQMTFFVDNSRPHRLWTSAHSRPKQTESDTWYWYYESRNNYVAIKMNLWPPKTRYDKASGAPALRQATLNRPQTKGFGHSSRVRDLNVINMVFKSSRAKKIGDRSKSRQVGQASYKLHCTVLSWQGLYRFHQWINSIQ